MSISLRWSPWVRLAALSAAIASGPAGASVYGPLDNFDVVNDTGGDTCGFEIELEGVQASDIYRTFEAPNIRYGPPDVTNTATGVRIRYQGTWDAASRTFLQKTPPAAPGYVPADDSCWTLGLGAAYENAGCEHFGVSQTTQPTATHYRWLRCNADGTLTPLPEIPLVAPVWSVTPPARPADPPIVRAEFQIPNPEGDAYGPAFWVKIYKTEAEDPIELDQLLLDDPLVAGAPTEIEWELLQAKPGAELAMNEAELGDGNEVVVRRYEFFRYNEDWGRTHTYIDPNSGLPTPYVDPENGEVVECVVDGCNDPTPEELGGYVGRQMAAFNLGSPACANGLDDDGDGFVDVDDPGCRDALSATESPQCDDGLDNDADGSIDLADAQCAGVASNDNENPAPSCGLLGVEPFLMLAALTASRRRLRRPV